jgi:hypothetical protein
VRLLVRADARALPLADRSVQCVVTSPPYWGLRNYGTAQWEGGDPNCSHEKVLDKSKAVASTLGGGKKTTGHHKRDSDVYVIAAARGALTASSGWSRPRTPTRPTWWPCFGTCGAC